MLLLLPSAFKIRKCSSPRGDGNDFFLRLSDLHNQLGNVAPREGTETWEHEICNEIVAPLGNVAPREGTETGVGIIPKYRKRLGNVAPREGTETSVLL